MKDNALNFWLQQVASGVNDEMNKEKDQSRMCRLQDAKEYLRRAYHALDDSPCEDNETHREIVSRLYPITDPLTETLKSGLDYIATGQTIPGYVGPSSHEGIRILQSVLHAAQTKATELLKKL